MSGEREVAKAVLEAQRQARMGTIDPHLAEQIQRMDARGYKVSHEMMSWALLGLATHYRRLAELATEVRRQEAGPGNTPSVALSQLLEQANPKGVT